MWSVHLAHPKFCNAPRPSPGRCFWHLPPLPARTRLEPARTPGDCVRLDAVPRADIGLGRAAGSLSGVAAAGPHGRGTRPRGVARARTTLLRVAQEGGGAKEHGNGLTLGMPVRLECRLLLHAVLPNSPRLQMLALAHCRCAVAAGFNLKVNAQSAAAHSIPAGMTASLRC